MPRVFVSLLLSIVALAVGGAVFAILYSRRAEPERTEFTQPRVAVRVAPVESAPYAERLVGYGLARALRQTDVVAEVTGVITWVSPSLEAGRAVVTGEELVRLDSRDLAVAKASAKAIVEQAETELATRRSETQSIRERLKLLNEELALSRQELQRQRDLKGANLSRSQLDSQLARTKLAERAVLEMQWLQEANAREIESGEAEVRRRRAEYTRAANDLSRVVIRAPYGGTIVSRAVHQSTRVTPQSPLFTVVDVGRVEVPVALAARHFGEISPGATARVRLREGGDMVWGGEVSRVSPVVSNRDRTFYAFLEVVNEPHDPVVPVGAFVVAEIAGRRHDNVVAVPRVAFVGERLFVVSGSAVGEIGLVESRVPQVARFLPDVALVASGLKPNDSIVLTNVEEIDTGSRVKIVERTNLLESQADGPSHSIGPAVWPADS